MMIAEIMRTARDELKLSHEESAESVGFEAVHGAAAVENENEFGAVTHIVLLMAGDTSELDQPRKPARRTFGSTLSSASLARASTRSLCVTSPGSVNRGSY